MKTPTILLAASLCACSPMTKETYTETRHFHYPKGSTPHLKEMYMHKPPTETQPVIQQPVIHQEVNTHPEDYSYIAELPQEEHRTLAQVREENDLLSALRLNKMLRQVQ